METDPRISIRIKIKRIRYSVFRGFGQGPIPGLFYRMCHELSKVSKHYLGLPFDPCHGLSHDLCHGMSYAKSHALSCSHALS